MTTNQNEGDQGGWVIDKDSSGNLCAINKAQLFRNRLNTALRATLADILDKNADDIAPASLDTLRAWVEKDANIEALAEWLEKGGWAKMDGDGDAVEARLVTAARGGDYAEYLTVGRDGPDGPYVGLYLHFGVPRAEHTSFVPWDDDERAEHLFGLDALQYAWLSFHWPGLNGCLRDNPDATNDWLRLLAFPWLVERRADLEERLDRESKAAALTNMPRVRIRSREYTRLPKVAAGMSWALGGPGVRLSRVIMDGHEYAPAPDLAIIPHPGAIVPASYALLPADHAKRPHQTLLPIDTSGAFDAPPLPVALADATQYAIQPAAGKLGLLVMGAGHVSRGKLHKCTLRELTQAINPDARLVRSHYETVCRGLVQLDALRLVLPDGMAYRVFDCPTPWRDLTPEEYDTALFVGLSRTFERTLTVIHEAAGASYRGDFLFDVTGSMMLPTKKAGLLRQYIRAAAYWNAYWKPGTNGEPDPERIQQVETGRWAAMTNYLPPGAVEYMRAKGKGDRRRLSESIKETLADAEYLASKDGGGLVKIARADKTAIRLLPPDDYLEAWAESRKGAHRIPGNTPEG